MTVLQASVLRPGQEIPERVEIQVRRNAIPDEVLSQWIGGYTALVKIIVDNKPAEMWVHEEGLIRALPINRLASVLLAQSYLDKRTVLIYGVAVVITHGGSLLAPYRKVSR